MSGMGDAHESPPSEWSWRVGGGCWLDLRRTCCPRRTILAALFRGPTEQHDRLIQARHALTRYWAPRLRSVAGQRCGRHGVGLGKRRRKSREDFTWTAAWVDSAYVRADQAPGSVRADAQRNLRIARVRSVTRSSRRSCCGAGCRARLTARTAARLPRALRRCTAPGAIARAQLGHVLLLPGASPGARVMFT